MEELVKEFYAKGCTVDDVQIGIYDLQLFGIRTMEEARAKAEALRPKEESHGTAD